MQIDVHSHDPELLQCINDLRIKTVEPVALEDSSGSTRTLTLWDARAFSMGMIQEKLAEPKGLGDLVLVLVDSNEKLNEALEAFPHLASVDFLIWPAPGQVLMSRIQLLANRLRPSSFPRGQRDRSETFRTVIEQLPIMIFVTEAGGQDAYMNAAMRRFFGVRAVSIENLGWLSAVHPEDRDALAAKVEDAVRHRHPYEGAALVTGGDDEWHTIHVAGRPHYYSDGSFAGMVESLREVTEERQADTSLLKSMRMFRELANLVPLLIWQVEPNGMLTYANDRWHAYTGLPKQPLRYSRILGVFHPEDRAKMAEECRRATKDPHPFRLEARLREQRTGAYKWHATLVTPIRDEDGSIKKWIGSAMDIDARKTNAEEIKRLYREMEGKRQVKDTFLAALSHELRTPLNIIFGYCHLLLETLDLGPRETEDLQGILREADKILALVEQLPWRDLNQHLINHRRPRE